MVTSKIPNNLSKENWKNDHLNFKHDGTLYTWCPLCMSKNDGLNKEGIDIVINVSESIKSKDKFGK